jgi:hypothetical protein
MRWASTLVFLMMLLALPAGATDDYVCWNEKPFGSGLTETASITRCRVSGTSIVNYGSEWEVPAVLYPDVGTASNGTCWYLRSSWSGWVLLTRYGDGTADLGFDPDGVPGGPIAISVTYPVCRSEPGEENLEVLAWDLISEYVHQLPDPVLNPAVPWGLTGAETFLAVNPPAPFSDALTSPLGRTLEVEAWIGVIRVEWGDGTTTSLPPEAFPYLTGYPDGLAPHVYETKTCLPPGSGSRCHPTLSAYPLTVSYRWIARWRVDGGAFQPITVPDTVTRVAYPVREVIAVLDTRR